MAPEQWRGETPGRTGGCLGARCDRARARHRRPPVDGSTRAIRERVAGIRSSSSRVGSPVHRASSRRSCAAACARIRRRARPPRRSRARSMRCSRVRAALAAGPFRGLEAFDAAGAAEFHGRDDVTATMLGLLRDERAVTIVGVVGHRQVVARARRRDRGAARRRLEGRGRAAGTPAARGDRSGARRAPRARRSQTRDGDAGRRRGDLDDTSRALDRDRRSCSRRISPTPRAPSAGASSLVIDQLEELETLADAGARDAAAAALAAAIADDSPVRIIVIARADFLGGSTARPGVRSAASSRSTARRASRADGRSSSGPLDWRRFAARGLASSPRSSTTSPASPARSRSCSRSESRCGSARSRAPGDHAHARTTSARRCGRRGGGSTRALAARVSPTTKMSCGEHALRDGALPRASRRRDLAPAGERMLEQLIAARIVIARSDDVALAHRGLATRSGRSVAWLDDRSRPLALSPAMTRRRRVREARGSGLAVGAVAAGRWRCSRSGRQIGAGEGAGVSAHERQGRVAVRVVSVPRA